MSEPAACNLSEGLRADGNSGGETEGAKGLMGSPSSGCVPGNVESNASNDGLLTD